MGEERDLARPVAEAQHVVEEEVLELVGPHDVFRVLLGPVMVGVRAGRDELGEMAVSTMSPKTALASSENWPVSIAQRMRKRIRDLGTEALTL